MCTVFCGDGSLSSRPGAVEPFSQPQNCAADAVSKLLTALTTMPAEVSYSCCSTGCRANALPWSLTGWQTLVVESWPVEVNERFHLITLHEGLLHRHPVIRHLNPG